jgi:ubiquinone/menaquinone biosynthesis C-methylase UbiE
MLGLAVVKNMLTSDRSVETEKFLARTGIHTQWQSDYLNADMDRFYDLAFDDILRRIQPRPTDKILDAGCGYCYHTVRLARSGSSITSVDFSDAALASARQTIADAGIGDQVTLRQADLTKLPFADESFDFVVSWGVIMHIPDMEAALSELARVLKKDGILVLCENNMRSLDVEVRERAIRAVKKLIGRKLPEIKTTPRGTESWMETESGGLLVRKTNMDFLTRFLEVRGLNEIARTSGQFTEAYTNMPIRFLKRAIYKLNEFYFRFLKWPSPAMGNLIYFRKS